MSIRVRTPLTPQQWAILADLLACEHSRVKAIQQEKAEVLKRSLNAGPALNAYVAELRTLKELVGRHIGQP